MMEAESVAAVATSSTSSDYDSGQERKGVQKQKGKRLRMTKKQKR